MRCMECGREMVLSDGAFTEVFRGEAFEVAGVPHYECACGEMELTSEAMDDASKQVDRVFRERHGLLNPEEIKSIRKNLGLTQVEMQSALGTGKSSVSRWETGRLVQSKTEDNLLRTMRDYPCAAHDMIERAEIRGAAAMTATVCTTSVKLGLGKEYTYAH